MTVVGFIGSGLIGSTVARLASRAGHLVVLSNCRGPAEDSAMTAAERQTLVNDPKALARETTRSEMRRPGTMERILGGNGRAAAGGLLAGVASVAVGALLIDGLIDTGLGEGGLINLGHNAPWAIRSPAPASAARANSI